jgi:hypothetical protein
MISDGKGLRPLNPARAKALCKPGCLRYKPKPQNLILLNLISKSLNPKPQNPIASVNRVQRSKNPESKKLKPEGEKKVKICDQNVNFFKGVVKV